MLNKSNKYSIKIRALIDSRTFFNLNVDLTVETQSKVPFKFENIVKRMVNLISKTGQNIMINNWYTSIPLVNEMLEAHNFTVVGTLHKNKK